MTLLEESVIVPDTVDSQVRRRPRAPKGRRRVFTLILWVSALLFTLPSAWLVITALKDNDEMFTQSIVWWPSPPRLSNFFDAVTTIDFLRYLRASIILSTISGVLSTMSSAAAGFAFARLTSRLQRPLFIVLVALMMTPPIITLIPTYLLFSFAGLVGTYWPWVLWGIAGSPFLIFLFRQAFATLPKELEEAAIIDGAGYLRIFFQIFLPLSKPILVTAFVIVFNSVWADYIAPLLFLTDSNTTLAVAVANGYKNDMGLPLNNLVAAGAVLYVIPMILVFVLAQRWYVQGMATTGLK